MNKKSIIVSLVFILIVTGIAAAQDSTFVYPVPVFGQGKSGSSYQIIPVQQPTAVPQIRPYPQGQQQPQWQQPQYPQGQQQPQGHQPQYPQWQQQQQGGHQPQWPQGQQQQGGRQPQWPQGQPQQQGGRQPQWPQGQPQPQQQGPKTTDGVQIEQNKKKDGTIDLTWTVTNKTGKTWDEDAVDILCSKGTELLSKSTKRWDLPKTIKANKPLTWTVNIRAPKRNESMEFCLMDGGVQLYCFTVVPR